MMIVVGQKSRRILVVLSASLRTLLVAFALVNIILNSLPFRLKCGYFVVKIRYFMPFSRCSGYDAKNFEGLDAQ